MVMAILDNFSLLCLEFFVSTGCISCIDNNGANNDDDTVIAGNADDADDNGSNSANSTPSEGGNFDLKYWRT